MDRIEAILRAMPATRAELRERTGLTRGSVQNAVEKMHAYGWCYVSSWRREINNGTGKFVECLSAGPGIDKPCNLVPFTQQERDDRRFKKLVKSGEIDERRRGNRMRYYERRAKARPSTWLSALIIPKSI